MADTNSSPPSFAGASPDHMFPTLTPAQIARIGAHGHTRPIERGEVLVEPGQQATRFFVVTAGRLEIVAALGADPVAVLQQGQFTGEVTCCRAAPGSCVFT